MRDFLANSMALVDVEAAFNKFLDDQHENKFGINALSYFPLGEQINRDYSTEVLRQSCHSFNWVLAFV